MQDNPIIKKRFEEKMKRLDRTSLSILGSWALNCAVASMPDIKKRSSSWFEEVKARRDIFVEEYRNWMIENMPIEVVEDSPLVEEQLKAIKEGKMDGIGTSGKQSERERIEEGSRIAEITTDIAEAEELENSKVV